MGNTYKKMAGTSAVFVCADLHADSPVERDGLVWGADELHLDEVPGQMRPQAPMANALALEGLEDYDPPANGDLRRVESLGADFVYLERIRAWVELQKASSS